MSCASTGWHQTIRVGLLAILLSLEMTHLFVDRVSAKALYTYRDDKGVSVITDQYEHIPVQYRSRVSTIQEDESSSLQVPLPGSMTKWIRGMLGSVGEGAIAIPGLSPYQSRILTYAGVIGLLCIVAMHLSRSQWVRFLSLWCLIMLAIAAPVLLYVSRDGPADTMRSKASQIQDKQFERLKSAP